jgi:cardiolipin synthase
MSEAAGERSPAWSAVWTLPNLISLARIAAIPVFWWLIVRERTTTEGLVLYVVVAATDWIDGAIARRTGQVSVVGKVLDPVADRLAIAAVLVALVIRGILPLWIALSILVRDVIVLIVGALLLAGRKTRLDVRFLGKAATFMLMGAIPGIAWGNLDLPLGELTLALGWIAFVVGIIEYYITAVVYLADIRGALARS